MSCYNCNNCTPTKDMSLCHASVNFGAFASSPVTLTFVSNSDGSTFRATGTTTLGILTITSANMPPLVAGVGYSVTSNVEWTLDSVVRDCVSARFKLMKNNEGAVITGTAETLTVCN